MLFADKTRIDEYIIEVLDRGSLVGPALFEKIINKNKNISKQALYKSLRKLQKNEVINKIGTHYSLNRTWLRKIYDFGKRHIHEVEKIEVTNILDFEDGDSVTYKFKNPFSVDITLGHLFDIIFDSLKEKQVVLNYHPHEWLILSRTETEKYWLNRFSHDKKMMLFNIGGNTVLDKKFKKDFQTEYVKINTGLSYTLKSNQYLSVVGDYVFEITTDPEFEKRVDRFFQEHTEIDDLAQKQINAISKQKYKSKLKLSKNKKKADMWRKKFKKDFYVPHPYYL